MRPNCHPASRGLTYLGLAAVVFTGFELGIRMAADAAGVWGIVAASVLFPVTITAAPLFALAVGHWIPALVVYGGAFAAGALYTRDERDGSTRGSSATS
jgi:hypothetical protein